MRFNATLAENNPSKNPAVAGVRKPMKNLSYIAVTLFLFSCGKREPDPVWDWGYLPTSVISESKREQCAWSITQPFTCDHQPSMCGQNLEGSGRV